MGWANFYIIGVFRRFVVDFWNLANSFNVSLLQSNKDVLRVCIYGCGVSTPLHTAWASCCMFQTDGQCESLRSGTATMESRFFYVHMCKKFCFEVYLLVKKCDMEI